MSSKPQITIEEYFAEHPVFSLENAAEALARRGEHLAVRNRLRHHIDRGRVKSVVRGIYAVVPRGVPAVSFRPDPFLVVSALRPDAIFSHHSALELLGAAHSVWHSCTAFSDGARRSFSLEGSSVRLLDHPTPLRTKAERLVGTRRVERRGVMVRTTGPERTLVEGFRTLGLAGGVEELVNSASAFPSLDFDLLMDVLGRYALRRVYAAVGWFLELNAEGFRVLDSDLTTLERERPRSPLYLVSGSRGGILSRRWNLVVPDVLERRDPDGRERSGADSRRRRSLPDGSVPDC